MTQRHLAGARILAQGLAGPPRFDTPTQAARAFGAHQGQDVHGVMASLALRTGNDLSAVLAAFDRGEIVRGYPMRGTVFAVAADSLAWMTQLCAGAPLRAAIARRPALDLEDQHIDRATAILEDLAGPASEPGIGRGILRKDLMTAWDAAGIPTDQGRGYHVLSELVCFGYAAYGPWRGDETAIVYAPRWLPAGSDLEGTFNGDEDAAIAELALRYFTTHGPASIRDFSWWSKLPLRRITAALALVRGRLEKGWAEGSGRLRAGTAPAGHPHEAVQDHLWWVPGLIEEYAAREKETMREILLPGFDELVLGYRDRLFLMDEERHRALTPGNNGVFKRAMIRRGEVHATWSRKGPAGRRKLVVTPPDAFSAAQHRTFEKLFAAFPYTVP